MSADDTVRIEGISAVGYHGVLEHERANGQRFVVDVEMSLDTSAAAESDDLSQTVDYGSVADDVVAVITGDPCNLIETVAARIATAVLRNAQVSQVSVTVHKPEAPIAQEFADVSVRVVRHR